MNYEMLFENMVGNKVGNEIGSNFSLDYLNSRPLTNTFAKPPNLS
jgi:hypothetical protein